MKFMRKQLDLLTRLALSENPKDQKKLRAELRELLQKSHYPDTVEAALIALGTPSHLIGYKYLVRAIEMQMQANRPLKYTVEVYGGIAKAFGTTDKRVERAMRHCVEVSISRADPDVLERYFGGSIDPNRGKPTLQHFITRVADVLRDGECARC